jgi:hypothetical protein
MHDGMRIEKARCESKSPGLTSGAFFRRLWIQGLAPRDGQSAGLESTVLCG